MADRDKEVGPAEREALEAAFSDWLTDNARLLEVGLPGDAHALMVLLRAASANALMSS